jgi:hypothetical protein
VPDTSDTEEAKSAKKQEYKSEPKQQPAVRNPSSRPKRPIHQSNSDFDYSTTTKRVRPNKNKEKQDSLDVAVSYETRPDCEPRPYELTSNDKDLWYTSFITIPYIISVI